MGVLRHRALALFLLCVSLTSLCVLLLPSQRGSRLHKIVKETVSRELSQVIQSEGGRAESLLAVSPTLLSLLGLAPVSAPASPASPQPPLVTAVASGQEDLALGWLRSVQHWLGGEVTVEVWDLGLTRSERDVVFRECNLTAQCSLVQFPWSVWPSHVRDLKLHTYRPLLLQSVLRDHGAVVWLDVHYRLTEGDLTGWLERAREGGGVLAWLEHDHLVSPLQPGPAQSQQTSVPTTTLTHPKMFQYFDPRQYEDYAFQHMVSLASLVLVTGERLSRELMLPWVQCVLTEPCINPVGAQDTGCRWDKKPQFRYSGCHRYDVSAFNIVLGQMFKFQESEYLGQKEFFRKVDQDPRETGGKNTTSSSSSTSRELEM